MAGFGYGLPLSRLVRHPPGSFYVFGSHSSIAFYLDSMRDTLVAICASFPWMASARMCISI